MPDYLTPADVACLLQVSEDTVYRRMGSLPGVINLGTEGDLRKRRYRVLRIPRPVLEKFLVENRIA
jgi:hypothetical protein